MNRLLRLFVRRFRARRPGVRFTRAAEFAVPQQMVVAGERREIRLPEDNGSKVAFIDILLRRLLRVERSALERSENCGHWRPCRIVQPRREEPISKRGRLGVSLQQRIAYEEVNKIRHGAVKWIRAVGQEALRLASEQGLSTVDFIFVDGDHSFEGIRQDWELWTPLVSKDGIVALHDSCSTPARNIETAGSVIFTRDHILRDDRFSLVEQVDSLSVMRRH